MFCCRTVITVYYLFLVFVSLFYVITRVTSCSFNTVGDGSEGAEGPHFDVFPNSLQPHECLKYLFISFNCSAVILKTLLFFCMISTFYEFYVDVLKFTLQKMSLTVLPKLQPNRNKMWTKTPTASKQNTSSH